MGILGCILNFFLKILRKLPDSSTYVQEMRLTHQQPLAEFKRMNPTNIVKVGVIGEQLNQSLGSNAII